MHSVLYTDIRALHRLHVSAVWLASRCTVQWAWAARCSPPTARPDSSLRARPCSGSWWPAVTAASTTWIAWSVDCHRNAWSWPLYPLFALWQYKSLEPCSLLSHIHSHIPVQIVVYQSINSLLLWAWQNSGQQHNKVKKVLKGTRSNKCSYITCVLENKESKSCVRCSGNCSEWARCLRFP